MWKAPRLPRLQPTPAGGKSRSGGAPPQLGPATTCPRPLCACAAQARARRPEEPRVSGLEAGSGAGSTRGGPSSRTGCRDDRFTGAVSAYHGEIDLLPVSLGPWQLRKKSGRRESGPRPTVGSVSEAADCGGDGTVRHQVPGTGLEGIGDRRRGGCRDPGSRRDLGDGDRCEFSGPRGRAA